MRNRNPKNLEARIKEHNQYLIEDTIMIFPNPNRETYLEVGSGKGIFLNTLATRDTESDFIGIEGQRGALLRCIEKADDLALNNISFYPKFIKDVRDHFPKKSLSGIYLNFSDPWPKDRHAKRRLTNRKFLEGYHEVLKDGAFIQFKTDNDILFDYSLQEFNESPYFDIIESTTDLHKSKYSNIKTAAVKTEYEEKFSMKEKNICYLRAIRI